MYPDNYSIDLCINSTIGSLWSSFTTNVGDLNDAIGSHPLSAQRPRYDPAPTHSEIFQKASPRRFYQWYFDSTHATQSITEPNPWTHWPDAAIGTASSVSSFKASRSSFSNHATPPFPQEFANSLGPLQRHHLTECTKDPNAFHLLLYRLRRHRILWSPLIQRFDNRPSNITPRSSSPGIRRRISRLCRLLQGLPAL